MIKNDRQYNLTKANASKFKIALDDWIHGKTKEENPIRRKAYMDALESQYEVMLKELAEYETLKQGSVSNIKVENFDDLPLGLIQARIASGLSQKDLADLLGMKEQQIQRYEATDYGSASFDRLKEIVKALGLKIKKEILIPDTVIEAANLFNNLSKMGFKKDFVLSRLLPRKVAAFFETPQIGSLSDTILLQTAASVGKIFGIEPTRILAKEELSLNLDVVYATRFKKASNTQLENIAPYTFYAHLLSLTLLEAYKSVQPKPIPIDYSLFRKEVLDQSGKIDFEAVLRYVWDLGIPVLPLSDSGNFHGACWRINGRNVIVLKQKTSSASRWLYDLLHEVRHAMQHLDQLDFDVIERNENFTATGIDLEDEVDANEFAADVILNGRADELSLKAIKGANMKMEYLKNQVVKVANEESVDAGTLANYIAFRLMKEQRRNWWGVATNLQTEVTEPWSIAQKVLKEKVNFDIIPEFEREILLNALK